MKNATQKSRAFIERARRNLRPMGLMLAAATLLVACGGGGGGGGSGAGGGGGGGSGGNASPPFGNTVPPAAGPGDVEAFFPDSTGDTWYYDAASTPPRGVLTRYFDTVRVTGKKSVLGQTASVFLETSSDPGDSGLEAYYYKNSGGLAYMGSGDPTDTLSTALAPYIEALFPVAAATVSTFGKTGVSFGEDLDGDGVSEKTDLNLTVTVAGFEAVDTPAGSFARSAHGTESATGSVRLSKDGSTVPFTLTQQSWAAPGVGVVRRTAVITVGGQTQVESLDARGYVVNGIGHGLTVPYRTLANLSQGNSDKYTPGRPSVACDGTNCLVVSSSQNGLVGELFDPKGSAVLTLGLGASGAPSTAFDGTNYVVVVSSNGALRVHRVSVSGVSLDGTAGIPVLGASATPSSLGPALAVGSSNSLIVYSRYDNTLSQHLLYGVLIDRTGTAQAPGEFPIAVDDSTHWYPAVAFDGTNYLLVWQHQSKGGSITEADIYGARVSRSGAVLDTHPIVVSDAAGAQYTPSIAFDGANYLVVWLDARHMPSSSQPCLTGCEIFGTRVAPHGALLDGSSMTGGIGIGTGTNQPRDSFPSVGFNGKEYLVAWAMQGFASTGSTGIRLARVSKGGALLSASSNGIALSGAPPASTVSEYALPVVASSAPTAIVWLDNTEISGSQKQLLAVTAYPF
jgi:hypothetical protein